MAGPPPAPIGGAGTGTRITRIAKLILPTSELQFDQAIIIYPTRNFAVGIGEWPEVQVQIKDGLFPCRVTNGRMKGYITITDDVGIDEAPQGSPYELYWCLALRPADQLPVDNILSPYQIGYPTDFKMLGPLYKPQEEVLASGVAYLTLNNTVNIPSPIYTTVPTPGFATSTGTGTLTDLNIDTGLWTTDAAITNPNLVPPAPDVLIWSGSNTGTLNQNVPANTTSNTAYVSTIGTLGHSPFMINIPIVPNGQRVWKFDERFHDTELVDVNDPTFQQNDSIVLYLHCNPRGTDTIHYIPTSIMVVDFEFDIMK